MEEKLRNLTLMHALIIGLVFAAVYYFSMYNDGHIQEREIQNKEQDIAKSKKDLSDINLVIKDADAYKQTMKTLAEEMELALKAIPSDLSNFELMKILSEEAKTVALQILSIKSPENFRGNPDPNAAKTFYETLDVEMDLAGTYNQIMLFLSNLTRLDKIIIAKTLDIAVINQSVQGKGNVTPILTFKIQLSAYRFIEAASGAFEINSAGAKRPAVSPGKGG